jgi:hypothetical protein
LIAQQQARARVSEGSIMTSLSYLAGSPAVAGLFGFGGAPEPAAATDIAYGTGEPGSACHKLGHALCRLGDTARDGRVASLHDGARRCFEVAGRM